MPLESRNEGVILVLLLRYFSVPQITLYLQKCRYSNEQDAFKNFTPVRYGAFQQTPCVI